MGTVGDGVTICIPSIPTRSALLSRAIASVYLQELPAEGVAIAIDVCHDGAWATRNRAAMMVRTGWLAFLDDDDTLYPHYIQHLSNFAIDTGADMVWGWYDVKGGSDPFPEYRGRQYALGQGFVVPVTYMVRTELVQQAISEMGGFQADMYGAWDLQDQPIVDWIHAHGQSAASPEIVWAWHHHGANTSGLPNRWT